MALAAFIGYLRGGFGQRSYWLDPKAARDSCAPDLDGPVLEKLGFGGAAARQKPKFGNLGTIKFKAHICSASEAKLRIWFEGRGRRGPT